MSVREITQFSMAESLAFTKECRMPIGLREQAMAQFAVQCASKPDAFKAQGGFDNVQRVRVLGDHGKPLDQQELKFDFVLKLPLHILEQKRREAERAKRQQECIAKAKELSGKKLDEFIAKVAVSILGRAAAELLRAGKAPRGSPALKRGLDALKPKGPRKPLSKADIFERAARQDRANRIEASKVAAQRYHEEHKNKSAQP
jgi:hypothetical protein